MARTAANAHTATMPATQPTPATAATPPVDPTPLAEVRLTDAGTDSEWLADGSRDQPLTRP